MELESNDEQSMKREWKEVQLKISETGVMSITDISSLDTKKSTKINEINQQSSLDQAMSNVFSVNKTIIKTEEKEAVKPCTALSKSKKVQNDSSNKKTEQIQEEKSKVTLTSAIPVSQNDSKSEEMEVQSIDQRDLSNELMTTESDKCKSNCSKAPSNTVQASNNHDANQMQNMQQLQEKIKTEPINTPEKRSDNKQNLTNNNFINNENKSEIQGKQNINIKTETKISHSAGSKINALSAKLQFQPKVGQVNNTYSKKSATTEKKSPQTKSTEIKPQKASAKSEIKTSSDIPTNTSGESIDAKVSIACSVANASTVYSQSNLLSASSGPATYVTAPSAPKDTCSSSTNLQQHQQLTAPTTESLASIGLHVSTTMPSQININSWLADRNVALNNSKNALEKNINPEHQLRSLPGIPQIGKDIICSTTSASPASSMGRFNIQTPSMSIYSITTSLKNNVYTSAPHSYTTASKQPTSKSNFDVTNMYSVPPCPDAIPISFAKTANTRKDSISKGTTVNEICAKISSAGTGSKINDICAKIGENSKEKNKIEAQRNKSEVPDLLKISKKGPTPTSEISSSPAKHIPNIPNVPIYTPSNSQVMQMSNEAKESAKRMASAMSPSQAVMMASQMQKMPVQKKHSQAVGYKTLRDPPKSWNPTLSKNNYVAVKNQAKEMQNQSQASYGVNDGSSASKQIPSKPAKIFKIRNMPRYLGNTSLL